MSTQVTIIGGGKRKENGDRLVAIIPAAEAATKIPAIIGRRGETNIMMIGGSTPAEVPDGRQKLPALSSALFEFVKFRTLGKVFDRFYSNWNEFKDWAMNHISNREVRIGLPTKDNVAWLARQWQKQFGAVFGGEMPMGEKALAAEIQKQSVVRTEKVMNGVEWPGQITDEEKNLARSLYVEFECGGMNFVDVNDLLTKWIRSRSEDIARRDIRAGFRSNIGIVESRRKRLMETTESPAIFLTDPVTAAYVLGDDKKELNMVRTQIWTIVPSGIMVRNPRVQGVEDQLIPWELLVLGDEDSQSGLIRIKPNIPNWVQKLQESGGPWLRRYTDELNKIGAVLEFESLGQSESQRDVIVRLPVRDPDAVIKIFREMRELHRTFDQSLGEIIKVLNEPEAEVGPPLRPSVIRNCFGDLRRATGVNQVAILTERAAQVRLWLAENGSQATPQTKNRVLGLLTNIENKLARLGRVRP